MLAAPLAAICGCGPLDGDRWDDCAGKCDGDGPRHALIYASQYRHSRQWRTDGEYGLASAREVQQYLESHGWQQVEVVPVLGIEAMLRDLDTRAEDGYEMIGSIGHSHPGGTLFADTTGATNTVQAGWSWYGFDRPASQLENGGPVDPVGLVELTDRLARVLTPSGRIVFFGCRTGAQTTISRLQPVNSAYKQGTPFFIPGSDPPRRYKTYAHAVAHYSARRVLGSKVRMSLGLSLDVVKSFYGAGALPSYYLEVDGATEAVFE